MGNADLVRGVSDCLSLARAAAETAPTAEIYATLADACVRALDTHHWLGDPEVGDLRTPLEEVRATAAQVLAEFETVTDLTRRAAGALDEAAERIAAVVRRLRGEQPREAAAWVRGLTELRQAQGHLLTLKEMWYADHGRIDALAAEAESDLASFGQRAVAFLSREDAFAAHHTGLERLHAGIEAVTTTAQAAPLTARLDELADGLRTVTEVVAGLDIADATVRTGVLERVADALGGVNRARATLDARCRALRDREARAGLAAELTLLGQTVTGALAAAGDPDACDDQLARVLAQLEELESRYAEFDDVLGELADKRTEIHDAFSARKQSLTDARARRAGQLASAAERVLETVARRSAALADADAVSTYFASDPLVAKVRRSADELRSLGDRVRAEELDGKLRSAREEAARALRDRTDLYADGGRAIRLGAHRFAVSTQPFDLTVVPHDDGLALALTGTDYRAPVTDPALLADRPLWDRRLPSESPRVARAEHLAARLLHEHGPDALAGADDLPPWSARPPRRRTTRATSGVCTTTTPPRSSPPCSRCPTAPAPCATPPRPAPTPCCSGRTARRSRSAPSGRPAPVRWPGSGTPSGRRPRWTRCGTNSPARWGVGPGRAGPPGGVRRVPLRRTHHRARGVRDQRPCAHPARHLPPHGRR